VIEDKNIIQDAAPLENVKTMADPGKAEPGRDIFACEPEKDIKSSNIVFPPAENVREQKEISSVNVGIYLSSPSSSSTTTTTPTTSDGTQATEESDGSAAPTEQHLKLLHDLIRQ
jgi:hypothetical protein